MKNENLEVLVRKYMDAESTEEEDKKLKTELQDEDSLEEYADIQALFGYFELQKSQTAIPEFKNPAMAVPLSIRKVLNMRWIAAAASVAILVAALFYFNQRSIATSSDTFNDPVVAAQNALEALELLSTELNKGQTIAVEQLKEFDSFNKYLNIY